MRPDQILVTLQREGTRVTARASEPVPQQAAAGTPEREHGYSHLTTPLRQRGLECTVEYGLSDYIVHAALPDGSSLIISPPQEPPSEHPPGHPECWTVTRHRVAEPVVYEMVYDSEPDGPHAPNGGSVPSLLSAIDARLDQLGVSPRPEQKRSAQEHAADAVLHRAGFVAAVTYGGEHYHRLPSAMTDPDEQRLVVTRAFDMLQAEGFDISCDPALLEYSLPPTLIPETSLGDRLGYLAQSIQASTHTSQAVAALSELTAPGDGVLQRVVEILGTTADWWDGFGDTADRLYSNRLRHIAENLDSYALQLRAIRGVLADRHTAYPETARVRADRTTPQAPASPRVNAALAASPTARGTAPTPLSADPAVRPAQPPAPPYSIPGR